MKTCRECKCELPRTEFNKQKNSKDGLWPKCKPCRKIERREYYEKNKESVLEGTRDWNRRNPGRQSALDAKARCKKNNRVPTWLTPKDFEVMSRFYVEAARLTESTGIKYVVDHIIPLNGRYVSGLHVPTNLQIMTSGENSAKYNNWGRGI